jgi:hypothetical protein
LRVFDYDADCVDVERGLPDSAVIVRGGKGKRGDLERAAEKSHRVQGQYAVSGCSAPDCSADEIAFMAGNRLPHPEMRVATAGALREAGFTVEPDGRPPHVSIKLPTEPTDEDWQRFDEAFEPPIPNPVGRR